MNEFVFCEELIFVVKYLNESNIEKHIKQSKYNELSSPELVQDWYCPA